MGFKDVFPVSAGHRIGLDDLVEQVTEGFPKADPEVEGETKPHPMKVAIIGRPTSANLRS